MTKKKISESTFAIYAAIAGNLAIAITKFVAAAITGSTRSSSSLVESVTVMIMRSGRGGNFSSSVSMQRSWWDGVCRSNVPCPAMCG